MSSYIDEAINPKTGKKVKAYFIDDYFGSHRYGVAFRKDGKNAIWSKFGKFDNCDIYKSDEVTLYLSKEEYNEEINKVINKKLPIDKTLMEMLEVAAKYNLK